MTIADYDDYSRLMAAIIGTGCAVLLGLLVVIGIVWFIKGKAE